MNKNIEYLRLIPLFRDLTPEELNVVWGIVINRSYHKKTSIFTEGSDKKAVYFIKNGLIKAFKTDEKGHEHIVSFLKRGDMFPHTGFFNNHPYPATAEAVTETKLLAVPIHSFEQLMLETPTIAVKVIRVLGEKIMDLQKKLQEITGQDVQGRGLSFLIKLAENYGTTQNGCVHIDLPMTNLEFANVIGTTRETANRFINQLRKQRLLEKNNNCFVILDYDRLKNWTHS